MQFKILGPLEVWADGASLDITAPRQRAVLAILLIEANRVVSLDRLIDRLYGGEPPRHAVGSVQAYVSHLRRLLEPNRPPRAPPQVLVSRPSGYTLVVDPLLFDAACFEAALSVGRDALAEGRPEAALVKADEALGLWRGPALAEFTYEAFAQPQAARLEALRIDAAECRIDAHLALGDHQLVVAEAQHLLSEHPLRERLWAALMLALYRCGRQGEALEAYQRCRALLAEELGVDPGPELRRLEADVLAQSAPLDWVPPSAHRPAAAPHIIAAEPDASRLTPRPAPPLTPAAGPDPRPEHLIGRDEELDRLGEATARVREGHGMVALIAGEAGIGKTAIVEAFGRALRTDDVMVWGLGHEGEGAPAFWMWGQVVRALAAADGSRFEEALARAGVQRDRLSALVPEWSRPDEAPIPPFDPAEARSRLFRDAAAALVAVSADRPVVAVLDDLHWADAASLALLEFVAPQLRRSSVLIVGTYRDDEVNEAHPLTATLGVLARLPATLRLFPAGCPSRRLPPTWRRSPENPSMPGSSRSSGLAQRATPSSSPNWSNCWSPRAPSAPRPQPRAPRCPPARVRSSAGAWPASPSRPRLCCRWRRSSARISISTPWKRPPSWTATPPSRLWNWPWSAAWWPTARPAWAATGSVTP